MSYYTLGVAMAVEDSKVFQEHTEPISVPSGALFHIVSNNCYGECEILVPNKGVYWLPRDGKWHTNFNFPQISIGKDGKAATEGE